jgi:hypothetical protein
VSAFTVLVNNVVFGSMGLVALIFFLRALLRNQAIALAVCLLLWTLTLSPSSYWAFAIALVLGAILLFVLLRFGLVAAIFEYLFCLIVVKFPITLDASAWYAPVGYAALAILAIIVLYAFRTTIGRRPLLASSHLDE